VSQNYLEHRARYLGIGNYSEEGFAFMERGIALKLTMFRQALRQPGLHTGHGDRRHGGRARAECT
jgi:hypothetical protein